MEYNTESEPLLNKEEKENNDVYLLHIDSIENKGKSKDHQVLQKSCLNCVNNPFDILEFFCCCCIDYDITKNQYKIYSDLLKRCLVAYDQQNNEHEKLLQDFFININELLQNDDEEEEYKIIDDNNNIESNNKDNEQNLIKALSKRVGFQTDNPRTDFRAGGLNSLLFMNYFITNYKTESKNILREKNFPFSLVCINLTYKISLILYLSDKDKIDSTLKSLNIKGCSRKAIKNFCVHLEKENENNLMFSIISQCLCFVFANFVKNKKNYLEIDSNIKNTLKYVKKTLNSVKPKEILGEKLKSELEKAKIYSSNIKNKTY